MSEIPPARRAMFEAQLAANVSPLINKVNEIINELHARLERELYDDQTENLAAIVLTEVVRIHTYYDVIPLIVQGVVDGLNPPREP